MRDVSFNPVNYAKAQLLPLVDELIACADQEGAYDQLIYFGNIKDGLISAADSGDIIEVFFSLSTANFMNFNYSQKTSVLLDKLLEKSKLLAESQNAGEEGFH
jgi:hypothetical protein